MKSMNLKAKGNRPPTTTSHKPDFRKMTEKGQDTHFSYNMTVLIGCSAEITTRSGEKYEGIFVAYSPTQEIMLEAAHLICNENDESAISTHYDVLVIPSDKLMAMKFENAVLNYATREFQTDTAISSGKHTTTINRELTPWDGGETETPDDLDLTVGEAGTNGWAPGEMFKKNAEKYGVVSSYDQQLSGYTTSLDKTDTETFKKHEEQALQIADEIERNTTTLERSAVENGDDEEAKFSAVVRDSSYSNANLNNNNNNNNSLNNTNSDNRTDKYVPPSRRNQNQNTQSSNSQPPPPLNSNNSTGPPNLQMQPQQQSAGGGNPRKPSYGGGGPRNSYTPSSNTFYQQDNRRNFDRRGPVQPQYGPSSSHGGDNGSRGGRGGKSPMDRRGPSGRDESVKKEVSDFQPAFNLVNPDSRRQSGPSNVSQQNSSPINHVMAQGGGPSQQSRPNPQNGSNQSPNLAAARPNMNLKGEKEKVPQSPAADVCSPKVEKSEKLNSTQTTPETPTRKPSDTAEPASESCSEKHVSVASPAPSETRSVSGSDAKSTDSTDSKKPFAFNVNAKEFNPTAKSFTPRSPATPPRPPSTPASTPQLMPVTQGHAPSYMQMPQGTIYLTPYSQTISPVAPQSLSSNNLPPRHMNPHRKNMGVSQRADLQSTIPVQAAGPLLAQGSLQNNGHTHPYASYGIPHQPGYAQPVRIHAPNLVQMYNSEGGEGHIQVPVHYIHSGAPTGGHPSNQQSTVNVSGQNAVIPGSPHGYTQTGGNHHGPHQHHISYPFVSVPVVGVGYSHPHGPNPLLNQRQYYE